VLYIGRGAFFHTEDERLLFTEYGPRSAAESATFVLDSETQECLHYEPITKHPPTKEIHVPREILESHPEVEIRNDLIDCSIDICSLEVRPHVHFSSTCL
jgi:hypothetical protein